MSISFGLLGHLISSSPAAQFVSNHKGKLLAGAAVIGAGWYFGAGSYLAQAASSVASAAKPYVSAAGSWIGDQFALETCKQVSTSTPTTKWFGLAKGEPIISFNTVCDPTKLGNAVAAVKGFFGY